MLKFENYSLNVIKMWRNVMIKKGLYNLLTFKFISARIT